MNHAEARKHLRVGMKVVVAREDPPFAIYDENGNRMDPTWINGWNNDMLEEIGKGRIFQIINITDQGVFFQRSCWGWPAQALELAELEETVISKQVVKVNL